MDYAPPARVRSVRPSETPDFAENPENRKQTQESDLLMGDKTPSEGGETAESDDKHSHLIGNDHAEGNPGGGAPEQNTNARTHGLHMKKDDYIERQSESDQEWIYELTESLVDMWRRRHGDRPPMAVRNRLESIAIDMHRVAWANDYFADQGLTQIRKEVVGDETITAEKLNLWASEIRHYNESIEKRMDKHGLLDPPEDRDVDELASGAVFASDDYVIEVTDDDLEHADDGDGDGDADDGSEESEAEAWVLEHESPSESSGDDVDDVDE